MYGIIKLTRHGFPPADLRLNVRHIVAYFPAEHRGSEVTTSEQADGGASDGWFVEETCEQIDALIGGAR